MQQYTDLLVFSEAPQSLITKRVTKTFLVQSRSTGKPVGRILWFGPWQQYTFAAEPDTLLAGAVMVDICRKIESEMFLMKGRQLQLVPR